MREIVEAARAKHVLQQRVLQLYKDDDRMRHEIHTAVSQQSDITCYVYVNVHVSEDSLYLPLFAAGAKWWLERLIPRVAPCSHLAAAAPHGDASATAAKADVATAKAEVAKEEEKSAMQQQATEDGAEVFDDFVNSLGVLVQLVVHDVKETFGGQLLRLSRWWSNDGFTKLKTS